ncbi:MAG TPA: hypothetical protein VMS17_02565 [Gemmataceae bacterium]|nr:hypothetical protein [Gemmataceae bacterium]
MPSVLTARTFLLCREIFQDAATHEFILVGPVRALVLPHFPIVARVNVFAHLAPTSRETYCLKLRLDDEEGNVVWSQDMEPPIESTDPSLTLMVTFTGLPIPILKTGKYEMVLLANDVEKARYAFAVFFPRPPKPNVAADPAGQ